MRKRNKTFFAVGAVILCLVAARIALPSVAKWYINDTLKNGVGGYYGEIQDLDVLLIAGRYTIRGLELHKISEQTGSNAEGENVDLTNQPPFLSIAEMRFHVFWEALFKGNLRGTLDINRAVVNVIHNPKGHSQTGAEQGGKGFLPTADALFPMTIEDIHVRNSSVRFINPAAEPPIDIRLTEINLVAENITNAREIDKARASRVGFKAKVPEGALDLGSHFSPLSEALSFDVNAQLNLDDLTPLNPFFLYYANFDVEKGRLALSSEVNGDEKCMEGYVKPVFENLEITEAGEGYKGFSNFFTEQGLALANLIIRNYPKDRTATKIEFAQSYEGDFSVKTWKSILNLFKNAFVEAYSPTIEGELKASSIPKSCRRKG